MERVSLLLARLVQVLRSRLVPILRSPRFITVLLIGFLMLGFILVILANLPETALRETRSLGGTVPAFAEDRGALEVPDASYYGFGYGEARASGLECGVGIIFLTDGAWRAFEATGDLPPPQLHCDQRVTILPESIVAVFVENQRENPSNWGFELRLFEVSRPYALWGLPAVVLFLTAAFGLPILFLRRAVPRWVESVLEEEEEEKREGEEAPRKEE